MFQTILVPLDGSRLAEEVLPYALSVAEAFGSRLILLQVVPASRTVAPTDPIAQLAVEPAPEVGEELALEEERARTYLEWTAEPIRQRGLEVECVVIRGSPAEAIVHYALEREVDLIALSTHGRTGLGRLVFGSVAERVVRETGKPVLLIKPRGTR